MSKLNTMYPDDEFLKNISDIMGKLDNKNEREIKQEIEQIGYKEFYRYYKEKDIYIKQLQQENKQLKKVIDMVSARLEYFLIGNLKYQSSQEEFIKLLNILKEVS